MVLLPVKVEASPYTQLNYSTQLNNSTSHRAQMSAYGSCWCRHAVRGPSKPRRPARRLATRCGPATACDLSEVVSAFVACGGRQVWRGVGAGIGGNRYGKGWEVVRADGRGGGTRVMWALLAAVDAVRCCRRGGSMRMWVRLVRVALLRVVRVADAAESWPCVGGACGDEGRSPPRDPVLALAEELLDLKERGEGAPVRVLLEELRHCEAFEMCIAAPTSSIWSSLHSTLP